MRDLRFNKTCFTVLALVFLQACVTVAEPGTGTCQGPVFSSDEVDQPPEPDKRVQPRIPYEVAREAGKVLDHPTTPASTQIEGEIKFKYVVNTDGSLCQISIVESTGIEELDEASLLAIKQWHYKPGIHDGVPVRVETEQIIEYIIKKQ